MFELKSLLLLALFLLIEFLSLSFLLATLILQRIFFYVQEKVQKFWKAKISEQILIYLESAKPLIHTPLFSHPFLLLSVMESYNHKLKGGEWEQLKREIGARYLLPLARKRVRSFSWKKRSFAARAFAMAPDLQDEPFILSLTDDPVFLVRSIASLAAISLDSKKGIDLTLQHMAKGEGYAQFFYRDILLQGSREVFAYLAEAALKSPDAATHISCLQVFAGKTVPFPLPFLEKDLRSDQPQILLWALKALVRNPTKDAPVHFLQALNHANPQIREMGAFGLKHWIQPDTLKALEEALKDPVWEVKLQAAASLKEMGEEGMAILKKLSENEVVRYALDFLG